MRNTYRMFYMVILIIASSCNRDDSERVSYTGALLISQVLYDSELTYEYTYNDAKQIVEEKSKLHYTKNNYQAGKLISTDYYIDPGMFSSSKYIVDSAVNRKEWVNPDNTEKNSTKTYFYDGNDRLVKSSDYLGICEYNYDDRGRITRQTFCSDDGETGYIDFIYDDNNNVLEKLKYWILESGQTRLVTTTEYEYDNKINPYKAFYSLMLPGVYTNANNITREINTTYFEVDNTEGEERITENFYDYNAQGYPTRKNNNVEYRYY